MNSTKKTLTILSAAAALTLGGIAVAQTTGSDSGAPASLGSSTTMQNQDSSTATTGSSSPSGSSSDTSVLGAGSSTDTSMQSGGMNASDTTTARMDRN